MCYEQASIHGLWSLVAFLVGFCNDKGKQTNHEKRRGRLKMRDMNLRHQFARVEIAGHENAGPIFRGGKCGKSWYGKPKCEKVSQRQTD